MSSSRRFGRCLYCGLFVEIRVRLGLGEVLEDHGAHSCDCPFCPGDCPNSRTVKFESSASYQVGPRYRGPYRPPSARKTRYLLRARTREGSGKLLIARG